MLAKGDAFVRNSCTVNPQEVWVLGHDDTTLRPGELDVLFVPSTTQACLDGRGHVDSTPAKSVGDRRVDVLIQVETEHHDHSRRPVFARAWRGWRGACRRSDPALP